MDHCACFEPPGEIVLTRYAVIFDLELTAWEGSLARNWTDPGEFREVVQIGAVKLNTLSLKEVTSLNVFTRPTRNPILSDYFVTLTGISNERLAREGVSFEAGYGAFLKFCGDADLWSYGRDPSVLNENIALHGLEQELRACEGKDISPWLRDAGLQLDGINSGKLAALAGAAWKGREHDGLDDARSIAAAVRTLVTRGMVNPFTEHP